MVWLLLWLLRAGFNMVSLPPGFDFTLLSNDLISAAVPFVSVIVLIAAYKLIKKTLGR